MKLLFINKTTKEYCLTESFDFIVNLFYTALSNHHDFFIMIDDDSLYVSLVKQFYKQIF